MTNLTKDQIRHEIINLTKTVKHLERMVDDEDWSSFTPSNQTAKWLKTQTVLKGARQCRMILKSISPEVYDKGLGDQRSTSGEQFHADSIDVLNRLELSMKDANEELKPRANRPKPQLPLLPLPKSLQKQQQNSSPTTAEPELPRVDMTLIPADDNAIVNILPQGSKPLFDIIPDTLPSTSQTSSLLPASFPSLSSRPPLPNSTNTKVSTSASSFLKTSTALQDELADELAQMARQLKTNTLHFSSSLEKDKAVLAEVEEKLEKNSDVLGKERVRLRDHRGKSGGTTWITILSILVVIVGFFLTFFIIRIT